MVGGGVAVLDKAGEFERAAERLNEQFVLMTEAYGHLMEIFRKYYLDIPLESPVPEDEDIISQLNSITEALGKNSEKLKELDDAKLDLLLEKAIHDLSSPLNAIKGAAENLRDSEFGELNEPQIEKIERITRNCSELMETVDDLKNLSMMGRNEVKLNLTNLPLFPMLSDIVSDMEILAVQEGLSLTLSWDIFMYN